MTSASISIGRPRSRSCSIEVLCAPTAAGAGDAPVDVDREVDAERLADRLGLDHHGAGDGAGAGIGGDLVERAAGQRGDRVEGEVAPELDPDLVADVGADRRLEAGGDQRLARARSRAPTRLAGRLAEREAVAVDVADDARRVDLGRRIDDAADRALGPDRVPDAAAGIDASMRRPSNGPPEP